MRIERKSRMFIKGFEPYAQTALFIKGVKVAEKTERGSLCSDTADVFLRELRREWKTSAAYREEQPNRLAVKDESGLYYTLMHKHTFENIVENYKAYARLKKQLEHDHPHQIIVESESGKKAYEKQFRIVRIA